MTAICDLEQLSLISNILASQSYAPDIDRLIGDEVLLQSKDIWLAELDGQTIPFLKGGSNNFTDYATRQLSLDTESFSQGLPTTDLFVVIPEPASLLARHGRITDRYDTGSQSLEPQVAHLPFPVLFPAPVPGPGNRFSSLLRVMDSHLSCFAYHQIATHCLRHLGLDVPIPLLRTQFLDYRCDLASRFSDIIIKSLFFSGQYFVSETRGGESNQHIARLFRCETAPVDKTLMLVGDSHCYSALSQLFSGLFKEVRFFWASRKSCYGWHREAILESRQDCDLVIECIAERFFLRNHSH